MQIKKEQGSDLLRQVEVVKGIYYVSCQDWDNRDFHGYNTPRGVTYNSYLIVDEKICLIDLVKKPFTMELLDRVAAIVPLDKIDYIVMNHVENDHASALPYVMPCLKKDVEIFTSGPGAREAQKLYGDYNYKVVKQGDSLKLGKNSLEFITLPMIHWPDSMASYMPEQKILFSNDAFGQHYCTSNIFDDENNISDIFHEAQKYYANILMLYSNLIEPATDKISNLGIELICPSHGVIWRSHIKEILQKYEDWSTRKNKDKVIVVYDTMWGATEQMARQILEGAASVPGVEAKLFKLSVNEASHIVFELQDAAGMILGSPTLNYGMLPRMGAFLTYVKGLKPTGKLATTFGTFGWSGGAQKDMEEFITKAGMELAEGFTCRWTADTEELKACEKFGYEFARQACKK